MNNPILSGELAAGFWRLAEWNLTTKALQAFTEGLLSRGITVMDHADIYAGGEAERQFGELLKQAPSMRSQMTLVSKCGVTLPHNQNRVSQAPAYNNDKAYILEQVEGSLARLQTDYLDLLLIHRPDYLMEHDEIAAALQQLHQQGKVRHFGVSNFDPIDFHALNELVPLVTNQIELSLVQPKSVLNRELVHYQKERVTMAWSPLAGGGFMTKSPALADALTTIAKIHNATPSQIALAWLNRLPQAVLPIIGSQHLSRYDEALAAQKIQLTKRQWYYLLQASTGQAVP